MISSNWSWNTCSNIELLWCDVKCTAITGFLHIFKKTKFVSINDYSSDWFTRYLLWCTTGFYLGPFLFLIYINDLNCAIKHCQVSHFADDPNLLIFSHSIKKISKPFNYNLKNLNNLLNAKKICLNANKTEVALFKSQESKQTFWRITRLEFIFSVLYNFSILKLC